MSAVPIPVMYRTTEGQWRAGGELLEDPEALFRRPWVGDRPQRPQDAQGRRYERPTYHDGVEATRMAMEALLRGDARMRQPSASDLREGFKAYRFKVVEP